MLGWSTSSRPPGPQHRPNLAEGREKGRRVGKVLEKIAAEDDVDRVGGNLRRELVAGREHFFGAGRQRAAGQAFDVHGDAAAATDVAQELTEAGAEIEHGVVSADVALEEVPAQHLPDGVLGGAIGLGKARRVQRIETQRSLRTFAMRRLS